MATMAERFLPIPILTLDIQMRFWCFVDRGDDCYNWNGSRAGNYPHFKISQINYTATRVAYRLHYGVDPKELFVCHECNNKFCVRKEHLYLGTHSENRKDAFADGLINRRGELHPNSRINDTNVREIRALYGSQSMQAIASIYGLSKHAIFDIIHRRSWSHVSD